MESNGEKILSFAEGVVETALHEVCGAGPVSGVNGPSNFGGDGRERFGVNKIVKNVSPAGGNIVVMSFSNGLLTQEGQFPGDVIHFT